LKAPSDLGCAGIHVSAVASPGRVSKKRRSSQLVIDIVEHFAVTGEKDRLPLVHSGL